MESRSPIDEIKRYLALALHWTWLLILMAIFGGLTGYYLSKRQPPIYQASALVSINIAPSYTASDYSMLQVGVTLAQTYAIEMITRPVLDGVIQRLGLEISVEALQNAIQIQPISNTRLLKVIVEDTDPERAALIANTLSTVFAEQNQSDQASRYSASKQNLEAQLTQVDQQIQATTDVLNSLGSEEANQPDRDRLETALAQYRQTYVSLLQSYEQVRLAEAQSTSTLLLKEPALPPTSPISPLIWKDTALTAVIGLMVAAVLVFFIEFLDDTLKDPDEVMHKLKLPVLGLITRIRSVENNDLVTCVQPRSPVSEAFRALRTNIKYASVDRPIHTLLVASPTPEDGKSTIASNLAVVLAQNGIKTTILDTDLRKPLIHKLMKLSNRRGVSDLFIDSPVSLDGHFQETSVAGLRAITSGSLPPNPAELLGSEKMVEIINEVKKYAEVVILDSPPLLAVTDAMVLAPRVDGVLLVVKPGGTKLTACKLAVEQLRQVGANILGVVLNDVEMKRSGYKYANYYKGYYYYHYYSDEHGGRTKSKRKTKRSDQTD